MQHPGKMARLLLRRIFFHGAKNGYWRRGDVVLDPFAGAGTTLLLGAYLGYRTVGIELEPKYNALWNGYSCDGLPKRAEDAWCGETGKHPSHWVRGSLQKNLSRLETLGAPMPMMLHGDSTQARQVLENAHFSVAGSITSPPYAESVSYQRAGAGGEENELLRAGFTPREIANLRKAGDPRVTDTRRSAGYSRDMRNVGNLPEGDFATVRGCITSPPYADARIGHASGMDNVGHRKNYGDADTQIGGLETGEFPSFSRASAKKIGRAVTETDAKTYWGAMARVYWELYQILPRGGVAAVVVKDYVRNKSIVPLCAQTAELLEGLGFQIIEYTKALLVEKQIAPTLFDVPDVIAQRAAKSHWRRWNEKLYPHTAIDFEAVIWARKGEQT